jgi:hypothetical protein
LDYLDASDESTPAYAKLAFTQAYEPQDEENTALAVLRNAHWEIQRCNFQGG